MTCLVLAVLHQLHAQHEALAAHVADDVMLLLQILQLGDQVRPHLQWRMKVTTYVEYDQ